jgi:glycosyltransferase involved in cell wall biosynthesis
MNILFVHNNFPAQFRRLIPALAGQEGVSLAAIGSPTAVPMAGVKLLKYVLTDANLAAVHPFARRFAVECRRAEEVLYQLSRLRASGFTPDIMMAHPGWGESLPLKTVFPDARLLLYCEHFYCVKGGDFGFDREFPDYGLDGHVALHLKNAATLLALAECDRGISPTQWQRSGFPVWARDRIDVIHEGIDTRTAQPAPNASFKLPNGPTLTAADEVITFVARNLEPLRGYHVFMRALPRILDKRREAHVVIVGGDGTSYGAPPPRGKSWKSIFLQEVADRIDIGRVHFVGRLPYQRYLAALQISSAHVYLTYPFILSWSALEAMSVGCVVIASDTPPVREVLDSDTGVLVPFFDVAGLADSVIDVLAHPRRYSARRTKARQLVVERYDADRICIPAMLSVLSQYKRG